MSTYPKLISWSYRTGRGLFSSKNDKDFVLFYYVENSEAEKLIEKLGYIPSNPFGPAFPSTFVDKKHGCTQRARAYGKIKEKYQKLYPDLEDKFLCKEPSEGEDLGNLIYTKLSDYAQFLTRDYPKYFWSRHHIKKEAFEDKEFISKLLNYAQKTYDGARIDEYQTKALPEFLNALKYYNRKLFYKLSTFEKVKELDKKLSPVGQIAKVHTLKPSKVWPLKNLFSYSTKETYFWDGEKIIIKFDSNAEEMLNIDTLSFVPKEDYLVKIVEEDSVTLMTEFAKPKR